MRKHTRWTVSIALLLLVSLLAVPGLAAQGRQPETTLGTLAPTTPGPLSPNRPLLDGGLLYKTSLDIGDLGFAVYDPGTDTWGDLTPFDTGCQMAVSATGQLWAYDHNGWISVYDPSTDTWGYIVDAPPGATGSYCNLEMTNDGQLLYTEAWGTTLWHYTAGVWVSIALPFATDAMGDYDPTTDQYVIGEAWTTNAHWIDTDTWTMTDYYSPVGNGEYSRFSVVMGNRYYFEAGGSSIHYFDLGNPSAPPVDTGVVAGWYTGAAGDRADGLIYISSLDGTQLWAYDTVTNGLTPLTGGGYGYHSSLAFTGTGGPPPNSMHIGNIWGGLSWDPYGRTMLRMNVLAHDQNDAGLGPVEVYASISSPCGGPFARTRLTKSVSGVARFHWGCKSAGDWQFCVDNLSKAGYTYNPADNEVPICYW